MQVLYRMNENKSFHLYENFTEITKDMLVRIRKDLLRQNGNGTMQVVVVDDKDKVIMSAVKLSEKDEHILTKVSGYKIKNGV